LGEDEKLVKCIVCGRKIEPDNKDIHHISYEVYGFPEVTVPVHRSPCHRIIHETEYYRSLTPRDGHGYKFRNGDRKEENKAKKHWLEQRNFENLSTSRKAVVFKKYAELKGNDEFTKRGIADLFNITPNAIRKAEKRWDEEEIKDYARKLLKGENND
jgi:hypothetical protein